jgi:hypothetical protein
MFNTSVARSKSQSKVKKSVPKKNISDNAPMTTPTKRRRRTQHSSLALNFKALALVQKDEAERLEKKRKMDIEERDNREKERDAKKNAITTMDN